MRIRQSKRPGVFHKLENVCTVIHRTAFIMRALRVAARRSERSLRTTDRALAWLKQVREEIDPAQGMLAIGELCDRFSATVQHQKPKTVERKSLIIRRIKKHWPTDPLTQITKVKPSHVDVWISRYRFGAHSRNRKEPQSRKVCSARRTDFGVFRHLIPAMANECSCRDASANNDKWNANDCTNYGPAK